MPHPFALIDEPFPQDIATFYRQRDGLPPGGARAIAVGNDGAVWAGGMFGLAHFDGRNWRRIGEDEPQNTIRIDALLAAGDALWIGMETGVACYQGGNWIRYWHDHPAPTRSARRLAADLAGNLWVNVGRGETPEDRLTPWDLWRFDGGCCWSPVEHPEPNLRDLATWHAGGILAINDSQLLHVDVHDWCVLADFPGLPEGARLTCLATYEDLVAIGTTHGLVLFEGGDAKILTGADGLPVEQLTRVAFGPDGALWAADARGVARYFGGQWRYYSAGRWLLGSPTAIAPDSTGGLWAAGGGGASHIRFETMTLAEKERYFEQNLVERHDRHHFVCPLILFDPEDPGQGGLLDATDNDGLHIGMYLGAAAMRYGVTQRPEDARRAREAFSAISLLESKTGLPGFPARAVVKKREQVIMGAGEWHESPDPEWLWKGDTSSDETAGHYYGYFAHYRWGPDEDKAALQALVSRETGRILDAPYFLPDYDGKPTRWARWEPPFLSSPEGADQTRLNSMEILSHMKVAHYITGEDRFHRGYMDLLENHGYLENVRGGVCLDLGGDPQYDDHLAFLTWYPLVLLEEDPELKRIYREAIKADWEKSRLESNVMFNYIFGATGQGDFESAQSLQALRDIPLDLSNRATYNEHRADLSWVTGIGGRQFRHPLPWHERPLADWEGNFYHLESHGDGRHVMHGTFYIMAYWLGRIHGFIE